MLVAFHLVVYPDLVVLVETAVEFTDATFHLMVVINIRITAGWTLTVSRTFPVDVN